MELFSARAQLCEFGRRLWQRGYVAANDGNLSVRLGDDRLLATPTGVSKGFMSPDDLILTDLDGQVIQGSRRPSTELKMHLLVYRLRGDVRAVVHAHPPVATAFALAGLALDRCLLPESVLSLGAVPIVAYGTPSTDEIPQALSPYVPRCDAVLLANHGALVWADSLEAAYFKMETLEQSATITWHAQALGGPRPLSPGDVAKLSQLRERLGLSGRSLPCEAAGSCPVLPPRPPANTTVPGEAELIEQVTRAVLDQLLKR